MTPDSFLVLLVFGHYLLRCNRFQHRYWLLSGISPCNPKFDHTSSMAQYADFRKELTTSAITVVNTVGRTEGGIESEQEIGATAFSRNDTETESRGLFLASIISVTAVILAILIVVSGFLFARKLYSSGAGSSQQQTIVYNEVNDAAVDLLDHPISRKREASKVKNVESPNLNEATSFTYEVALPRSSFFSDCGPEEKHCLGPPKLELPQLPYATHMVCDSFAANTEGVYYSDLKETSGVRLFNYKELCIIMSLKVGKIHNRWMASITVPNEPTKCVFVSTVTDQILRTREIQWDEYVKRVLELPEIGSIVNTEGICIDGAKLYLIQEHLTCVTFESNIRSNQQQETGSVGHEYSSADVKRWTVDILKGLELIHSYGLLHPGLSSRKILFTDQKIPKLYDFCLAEDASHKVLLMKEKMVCSRNQLAPEALSRNEYSTASDVWSVAVMIWELLTGSLPFPSDIGGTLNKSEQRRIDWPIKHNDIRNERVMDCWQEEFSLRPSMRQLRLSFEENVSSTKTGNNSGDLNTFDMYVPMKGIITTDDTNKKSNSV
ncbi:fibroblast growth factor receptor 3-like isoform X2 [Apostichopus japonicus]|uniref:fibroblast growth factor receptor 3-like isoform X2 n=1 Tax=Stichopus japonicus TaxID=307972 RepID=UPI003AB6F60E